jgi:uncharacterized RDD family membrane protein YckC
MGRRIVAALLDVCGILLVAVVFYVGAIVDRYDRYDAATVPDGASGSGDACAVLSEQYSSCVTFGRNIYVSSSDSVTMTPFVLVTGLLVFVLLQGLTGATPGKLVTGLRVVGPDGRRPGLLRALVRTVLWVVDGFPWPIPILGWLIAVCNRRRRRLGDMVAGTVVVRRRAARPVIR